MTEKTLFDIAKEFLLAEDLSKDGFRSKEEIEEVVTDYRQLVAPLYKLIKTPFNSRKREAEAHAEFISNVKQLNLEKELLNLEKLYLLKNSVFSRRKETFLKYCSDIQIILDFFPIIDRYAKDAIEIKIALKEIMSEGKSAVRTYPKGPVNLKIKKYLDILTPETINTANKWSNENYVFTLR